MKIGFYAGSFDPFTNGHLHVAKTASRLFDKIVVGIGINPEKTRRFDKQKMKTAIEELFHEEQIDNAEVIIYDGYTVDAAAEKGANFLVRGLRNRDDYDQEEIMAGLNKNMSGIDTVFVRAGDSAEVSSSMVYELFEKGEDISEFVPIQIINAMKKEEV